MKVGVILNKNVNSFIEGGKEAKTYDVLVETFKDDSCGELEIIKPIVKGHLSDYFNEILIIEDEKFSTEKIARKVLFTDANSELIDSVNKLLELKELENNKNKTELFKLYASLTQDFSDLTINQINQLRQFIVDNEYIIEKIKGQLDMFNNILGKMRTRKI